jgi:crossover junction endodeoxyribonuclease RuvC
MIGAFDIGTKFGYAFRDVRGGPVISGVWDLTPRRFDGGGMRYLRFRDKLAEAHAVTPFTRIYFEEVRRHRGTDAAHVYGGFLAELTAFCEAQNPKIPYSTATVQEIKKFATGKGNASKDEVIEAVEAWGFRPIDDNEADALAILFLKLSEIPDATVKP